MTETPKLIDIDKNFIDIRFFTTSKLQGKNVLIQKSDAGTYNISSPGLTAVDLIQYQTKLGGLNRMLATIEELTEDIEVHDIINLLTWYPHKSTLQRLGFLLDEVGGQEVLSEVVSEHLRAARFYPVLLSPNTKQKPGAVDNKWKVDVNIKLERQNAVC